MKEWQRSGAIVIAGATLVGIGADTSDRFPWLGWPLFAGGVVALAVGILWVPSIAGIRYFSQRLGPAVARAVDLDTLAENVAGRIALPKTTPAPRAEDIADLVLRRLREQDALRPRELTEVQRTRRVAAHDTVTTLESKARDLRDDRSSVQPLYMGSWSSHRLTLAECPIYDNAVRATERAFQALAKVNPQSPPFFVVESDKQVQMLIADAVSEMSAAIAADQ